MTAGSPPIRVVIADDHAIFRRGVRLLLETEGGFTVVGEAGDGGAAADLARELKPDVILLDVNMPHVTGIDALRTLAARNDPARPILLTAAIEAHEMAFAVRLGARGVLLKDTTSDLLFTSIDSVMAGAYWIERDRVSTRGEALRRLEPASRPESATARPFNLTRRELDILQGVAAGLTNKDIARERGLSEDTVKHHLTSIFDKVGASNRLELAIFAVHHRLVGA